MIRDKIFWQEVADEAEKYIIEDSVDMVLEGYPVTVMLENFTWRVWLKGAGNVGADYDRDIAIQEAYQVLQTEIIRKSDIVYVERIGRKYDPRQKFYMATLEQEGRKVLITRINYDRNVEDYGEFIRIRQFPQDLVVLQGESKLC